MIPTLPRFGSGSRQGGGLSAPVAIGGFLVGAGVLVLFTLGSPGDPVYRLVRQVGVFVFAAPGLWMVWRGVRGLVRALRLRRLGVEGEAEVMRKWTEVSWSKSSSGMGGQTRTEQTYLDYRFSHRGRDYFMQRVSAPDPAARGVDKGSRVAIQLMDDDPSNNRLLAVPAHVTPVMRGLQIGAGALWAGAILVSLAPRSFGG